MNSASGKRDLERRVDRLYDVPLEEFTALRNELAKELRRSGDRGQAEEVGRLRKPTTAAWAINRLSRDDRQAIRRVLDAGKQLRKAQQTALGGGSGEVLRKASSREREAVADAVEKASGILGDQASTTNLERVRNSLHAAAGDDDVRAAIEKGRLNTDHTPVGLGPIEAGAAAPPRPSPRSDKPSAAARKRAREAQAASRKAARRLEAAQRELERSSDAAARAQERLAAAQAELDEAQADAEAAAAELERAERDI